MVVCLRFMSNVDDGDCDDGGARQTEATNISSNIIRYFFDTTNFLLQRCDAMVLYLSLCVTLAYSDSMVDN